MKKVLARNLKKCYFVRVSNTTTTAAMTTTTNARRRTFPSFRVACKFFQLQNPNVSFDEVVVFVRKAVKVGEVTLGKL